MIEIDVTATGAAPRAGGFVYAAQGGQQVRLAMSDEWRELRVVLQFSSGAELANVPLQGETAEIPRVVLGTPWKTLRLGITGYHPIVPHARALGPFWCELGAIRPEGMMGQGEGGSGIDTSAFATKDDLQSYATREEMNSADAALGELERRIDDCLTADDLPDTSAFALKSDIPAAPDLSGYARKTELPDVSTLAAQQDVDELDVAVNGLQERLDAAEAALAGKAAASAIEGMATQTWVQQLINSLDATQQGY